MRNCECVIITANMLPPSSELLLQTVQFWQKQLSTDLSDLEHICLQQKFQARAWLCSTIHVYLSLLETSFSSPDQDIYFHKNVIRCEGFLFGLGFFKVSAGSWAAIQSGRRERSLQLLGDALGMLPGAGAAELVTFSLLLPYYKCKAESGVSYLLLTTQ